MNNLNYVLLQGRVTMNPELSEPVAGVPLCRFTIALNRYYMNKDKKGFKEEVSYFRVLAWFKLAENCMKYLTKGREIRVAGRLQQDRWKDSSGMRERVFVVAQHVEFAGKRKETEDSQEKAPEELIAEQSESACEPLPHEQNDLPDVPQAEYLPDEDAGKDVPESEDNRAEF